jgi:hypothetical protein
MNHVPFITDPANENVVGKVIDVPCKNDNIYDNEDGWAVPIQDSGIFTGFDFLLAQGEDTEQPTADSIGVFRLRDKNYNEWLIYGTKNDFLKSCASCCGDDGIPMPGIDPAFDLMVAPCQVLDILDDNGEPYMLFGIPTLGAGEVYFPYGVYNNATLTPASASGYATKSDLLAFLNGTPDWNIFTWDFADADEIVLRATGGDDEINQTLCVSVIAITPSA